MSRLIFAVLVGVCLAASLCAVSAVDAANRQHALMMRMQADALRAGVEPLSLSPIVNKQCLPSSIIKTQCADDDKCNPEDLLSPGAKLALHQSNEDDLEDKQKIAIKECLARQIDSHMQQLGNVNAVASAVRSRYLNLQTEKNIIQEKLRMARDRLFTIESKEREELSDLQRREAKAAFEAHTRAMAEEEKEKKAVVEQFQKSKELAKQRAQQEREQEEVNKKDASEQKTKLAEQTEKANTRLVEEKVKKMLAQKETINESSHQALQAALAGALPAQAVAAAAAGQQQAGQPQITDPITAKLVPGTGLLNPTETNPKIVDSLGAVGDNQVASKPHKDESVTANTDDDDDDDDEESSGKGQIVVHIGENGVTVGTEEHAAPKEHSEESSEASKEHSEESSEESSIHEAAAEIAAADEAAARELSEAAAEHVAESAAESAEASALAAASL